jgi:5-methylcytosine-specific restriction endonuclease McrA
MTIRSFLELALSDPSACWHQNVVHELASQITPDSVFGRRSQLLKADFNRIIAAWFAIGLADPLRYVALTGAHHAFVFRDVLGAVSYRFHDLTKPEQKELAVVVARHITSIVDTLKRLTKRRQYALAERSEMLALAGTTPRCWICGYEFDELALNSFLGQADNRTRRKPDFLDVYKPLGLTSRDTQVEIDHVLPFSLGGGEANNLALSCGWCNRHKGAMTSIYESEGGARPVLVPHETFSTLPQPFWTIRTLAIQRTCEHPEGCSRNTDNAEMTVAPVCIGGSPTPANLRVTCYEHDPIRDTRLQTRRIIESIWGKASTA